MTDFKAIDDSYDDEGPSGKGKAAPVRLGTLGPGVIDVVTDAGSPTFLVHQGRGLEGVTGIGKNGDRMQPFPLSELPWAVPSLQDVVVAHEHDDPHALFIDIRHFIGAAAVVPDERWIDLLAGWALLTYRAEDVHHLPLILIHGVPERGKTRLAKWEQETVNQITEAFGVVGELSPKSPNSPEQVIATTYQGDFGDFGENGAGDPDRTARAAMAEGA